MKILCDKSALLKGVNTVSKAVSSRTTLPILECILLSAELGNFKLVGNDLELGIESHVSAEVVEDGVVALESKIFSEIIRKLPDSKIEITVGENNVTTIKCAHSEFKIAGQPGHEFPLLPDIDKDKKVIIKQSLFKDMIRQTIFSTAVEETRKILTGELIDVKDQCLNLVAVDGYRVSLRRTPLSIENKEIKVVVPGKTLSEISKILSAEEETEMVLYVTDRHILFELGDSIVVSRLLEGEFLKYEQAFNADYQTKIIVNRKEYLNSIERAALISRDSKNNPVKTEIKNNKMIITSNTDLGTAYEEVEIQAEGESLVIAFNPKYLIDALKNIEDEQIQIIYTSQLSPSVIVPVENDAFKYLICPIRFTA